AGRRREDVVAYAEALAPKLAALPGVASVRHRVDAEAIHGSLLRAHRWALLTLEDYDEVEARLAPGAIAGRVAGLRRALAAPMAIGAARWITADPLGFDEILGESIERRYGDPFLRPSGEHFLAPSGDAALVMVRPERSAFDTVSGSRLMSAIRAAERELLDGSFAGRGIDVGHTGAIVYALADRATLQRDLGIYFVVVPLAVLLVFHLGLRTLRILPFVTIPLFVTTAVTFALSLFLYGRLTMISVAFAAIFYGLGVDSAIYFYGTLRMRLAQARHRLSDAVTATMREIGVANVVASSTTAAAFFVIGLSDFTGVSQLGVLTAIAMCLNVVSTFVVLPSLLFLAGERALPREAPAGEPFRRYGAAAEWLAEHPRLVLYGAAAILGVAAAGLTRARLDTDLSNLRPAGGEAERVERRLEEAFGRTQASAVAISRGRSVDEALADA
ncbi:MAG: MMPL family transporter, partial [Candidatus Binatia bacterium]